MDFKFWIVFFLSTFVYIVLTNLQNVDGVTEKHEPEQRLFFRNVDMDTIDFVSSRSRRKRNLQMIISQHFSETTVMPGVDVSLQCTVNGPHPARFIWERDGVVVSANTDSRYTIGQTMAPDGGVVSQLNVSHSRVDDGGLFSCVAAHGETVVSHSDRVNVYGPPYIRTLPPLKVQSGQSVTLRCPYYGYPVRDVTWEHKGKELITEMPSNRYQRSISDTALSIEIFGRKPKLRLRSNVFIKVSTEERKKRDAKDDVSTRNFFNLSEDVLKTKTGFNSKSSVKFLGVEKEDIMFDEKVRNVITTKHNLYSPVIREKENNSLRVPSDKIREKEETDSLSKKGVSASKDITITKAKTLSLSKDQIIKQKSYISNETTYRALRSKRNTASENKIIRTDKLSPSETHLRTKRDTPSVSADGVLTIPRVTKSDSTASYACVVRSPSGEMAKRSFELHVVEPPQLEDIMLPPDLQEGQIVQIHCNLKSGDSPVYFSWLKDGKKIPTHLKIVERTIELFSVLIIKNVSLDHCGTYTCVAANHVAKVNRTVNLYIKVAPKWSEEPQNSSLLLGRNGHISCSANGYPQPQTHWLKKDVISDNWRPVLEVAGGGVLSLSNGSLMFDSVALSDAGLYTCHVENGVGEALSKTIWISVNKPVTFDLMSRNMTSKLGQHISIECQAKGDDPIRIMWTRNGKPINPLTQRVKISEVKTEEGLTSTLELLQTETSDGALYQCRADNPFGADVYSVQLNILEPPSPPTDLSVDSIKSRSVKLSWRDSARSLAQYYQMQITNSQRLSWSSAKTMNISRLDEIRHTMEVDDLQPATSYTARVAGGNRADLSLFSAPVRFTTTEEAPSSPPLGVKLEQTESPGELKARWLPPPADAHNGLIVGYRVRAVPQITGIKESEETSDKIVKTASLYSKQETTLSGLLKGVRYAVSIAALNNAGTGPFSIPIFQDTREGAPEEGPSSVECGGVTSTALRVSWQPIPPHKQAGALIGYNVLYAAQGRHWLNATSMVTEVRLQGLSKYTNYTIKVAGFSSYGSGPFSFPIVCSTMQDVPGAPAEIKVLSQSTNTVLVSWKKPKQPNGRLLHYTVYYKPTASNDGPQTVRVEALQRSEAYERTQTIELKGLDMGQQYDVWVTASTAVGEGPESRRVTNTPSQRVSLKRSEAYERTQIIKLKGLDVGQQYDVWVTASTAVGEGPESRRVTNTPSQRVVAGVASLGGEVTAAVRNSLLLECKSVGSPPPRTVWYHNQNIITHHPRFTRNRDDSLLIKSIDQSLSGNYTCLAKNLYGSDSVVYSVKVLPLPDPPSLRATPYKDSIVVEWDEMRNYGNDSFGGISYNLTWREGDGMWQEAWPVARETRLPGIQQHTLTGLKCGTKYSIRVTATDSVGTSVPAHIDVSTLGGAPVSPPSTDWLWSNATHIYIQLSGWDDGGCDVIKWDVEYKPLSSNVWMRAENRAPLDLNLGWSYMEGYQPPPRALPTSYAVGILAPASWYQLRVTAVNDAGMASTVYTYATKTLDGEEIGPPSELLDLNMLVIICSSVLLVLCLGAFVGILLKRHRQNYSSQYRHSITDEVKSRNESVASHSEQKERYAHAQRIYTSPLHTRKNGKNEMFEISPYAEFALGFRTFDHVENQDLPSRLPSRPRFDTETSFQNRSESDDSDSTSKATVTAMPRRHCRTPHRR